MSYFNRTRLVFMCFALLIPSVASAQTASSVERAFTPLVLPTAPPAVRTRDQRICDVAAVVAQRQGEGPLEVLTETVIEPYDATNPFHREAMYRLMAQELIRTGGLLMTDTQRMTPDAVLSLVRRQYSVTQIRERVCGRLPSGTNCAPRFAWSATFQQSHWCAVAELGRRLQPGQSGFVQGSLEGQICIGSGTFAGMNPFPCPSTTRRLTIRNAQTHTEISAHRYPSMTGDAVGDAFGYGGLGSAGTGWGGGGTGEGTIGMGNIGTMGAGSGTGSGEGYSSGAGRGLRSRGVGPTVRAAPADLAPPREEGDEERK